MGEKKISIALKMLALSLALVFLYQLADGNKNKEKNNIDRDTSKYSYKSVSENGQECVLSGYRMGTTVSVTLYGEHAEENAELAFSCIDKLDGSILTSQVDALTANYKVGEPYQVDEELFDVLGKSLLICEDSNGALDVTIEPLNELWAIDGKYGEFKIPDEKEIKDIQEKIGYEHVRAYTENDNCYILFDQDGMEFAIGAVGKGYALDLVRDILARQGAEGACIMVGGSILVYGRKPDNEAFTVGIRNPRGEMDDMIGVLTFRGNADICVSTSGDYEKYVEAGGKRYHHILDRSTGSPSDSGLMSVTVVCKSGLASDGLSTACFILGYDKSLALLKKYDAEAVFIDKNGNITVTDGLKDIFTEHK
ncbi:MAG: FAD:protein FMN transferase [Clostridium sp.]|nr:FAD:protein FMN transferase [Clostridium sp.]MCM1400045.1 FAD:protein FMN transferase [Clostridium sp.]MCM1459817.1 FAD:protein FMN transferase [Bacteroides sp.]